ncbi:uncharacterized protein [Palaemon carinicauda]|uniref:uncharacterized protein isoform X3 n=1 Tax=Palaemon carinicauda TaxID=392227 RepID=UPI0035B694C0
MRTCTLRRGHKPTAGKASGQSSAHRMWPYLILMKFIVLPFPVQSEGEPLAKDCEIVRIEPQVNPVLSTFNFTPMYNLDPAICHGKVYWSFVIKNCNEEEQSPITLTCSGVKASADPNETDPKCSKERIPPYSRPLFEEAGVKGNSKVKIPGNFTHNECYCFKIRPNGYSSKLTVLNAVIGSSCRPLTTQTKPQGNQTAIIMTIVVIVIILITVMICLVVRKLKLSQMRPVISEDGNLLTGVPHNVLVIYAKDEDSHCRRVNELIKELQSSEKSKIYDIHTHIGQEKLADPNEWLQKRLREDRILILLSLSLKQHMEIVFSTKEEKEGTNPALVHSLRSLVGLNDYSKVFVARFSSELLGEESGDYTEILTKGRRYALPANLEELKRNMLII